MRVECEACRELVVASFGVEGGVVRATCPGCQHVMDTGSVVEPPRAAAAAAAAATSGEASAASACPKCGSSRRDGAACPTCGLAVARMASYTEARDAAAPEAVRAAWRSATEAWAEPSRHDELLRLVAAHDCYAWAAGKYRTRRDAVGVRQLERLRRAAEATLLATAAVRADASSTPYRAARGVLAILIAVVVVGLVYATVIRDQPRPHGGAGPPARTFAPGYPARPSTVR